ncbi:MAG: TPM domain-containing protein [Cypionkella sp.]
MAALDQSAQDAVTAAVGEAELRTSGEIVTVLADRSDGYTDVALLWAAGIAFTAMALATAAPGTVTGLADRLLGRWSHLWTAGELMTLVTGIGLLTFLATWAAQGWQPLKFALVPGPVKAARVRDAAVRLFKVGADRRTHGRTGVLLYLSMREHRAEIVADEAIAEKVDAEVWGEAMADMLEGIAGGRVGEGLAAGVRDVGAVLAEHFPRHLDDVNELPDRLIEV